MVRALIGQQNGCVFAHNELTVGTLPGTCRRDRQAHQAAMFKEKFKVEKQKRETLSMVRTAAVAADCRVAPDWSRMRLGAAGRRSASDGDNARDQRDQVNSKSVCVPWCMGPIGLIIGRKY